MTEFRDPPGVPHVPEPEVLSFPATPTPADIARRLGVDAIAVGYVREPAGNQPGSVDVNIGGTLTRFHWSIEAGAIPTSVPSFPVVTVTRLAPSLEVQRAEIEASDRARRPEVEVRHHAAIARWADRNGYASATHVVGGKRCRVCGDHSGDLSLCCDCGDIAHESARTVTETSAPTPRRWELASLTTRGRS